MSADPWHGGGGDPWAAAAGHAAPAAAAAPSPAAPAGAGQEQRGAWDAQPGPAAAAHADPGGGARADDGGEQAWPAAAPAAADPSGIYVDDRGREQGTFALSGTTVNATFPDHTGYGPESGTFDGFNIQIFGMAGTYRDGQITWTKNGKQWTKQDPNRASNPQSGDSGASWQAPADRGGQWSAPAAWNPEEDKRKLNEKRLRDFNEWQEEYKKRGTLPGPSMQDEESQLFSQEALGSGAGIAFDLYDEVPADITGPRSENVPELTSFDQLYEMAGDSIPQALMDNIRRCQYTRPTPVQKYAMLVGVAGRDLMCCAQTGSGKTVAYLVPAIAGMMRHHRGTAALQEPFQGPCTPDTLILSPTRELCLQIFSEALKFCHGTSFRCTRVYGKEHGKVQLQDLARGADLMVATPGRLWDWVDAGVISVKSINCLVLDEADRMLDMAMESHIREVVENYGMPSKDARQTMMFSATFPERCQKLALDYMFEYIWVGVGVVGGATNTVAQYVEQIAPEDKFERLTDYLHHFLEERKDHERLIVFTNSKAQAKGLDEKLYSSHFDTGALHGDLEQHEREDNLAKFRSGAIDVLIATDLASRGLDIHGVSHVINYDLPHGDSAKDKYVQRIGRTGRIGHHGKAVTFLAVQNGKFLDDEYMLIELPKIMAASGDENNIPGWLTQKVTELEAEHKAWSDKKSWKTSSWERKDARESPGWQEWSGTSGSGPDTQGTNQALEALERNYQAGALQPPLLAAAQATSSSWATPADQANGWASAAPAGGWEQGDAAWSGGAGAAAQSWR